MIDYVWVEILKNPSLLYNINTDVTLHKTILKNFLLIKTIKTKFIIIKKAKFFVSELGFLMIIQQE